MHTLSPIDTIRHAITLNGSFFSTQRMLLQYVLKLIFLSVTQFLAITTINKIPKAADGLP